MKTGRDKIYTTVVAGFSDNFRFVEIKKIG